MNCAEQLAEHTSFSLTSITDTFRLTLRKCRLVMEFYISESTARASIPQAESGKKKFNIKIVRATGLPDVAVETSKPSCQITSRTHKEQ